VGFPIRTSADQRLVDGFPQLFAVTHVLHRFLAPRHPPLALCSLERTRCSCLLCSSQGARQTHRGTPQSSTRAASSKSRNHPQTPSKRKRRQIRRRDRRGRQTYDLVALDGEPTSAPTRCPGTGRSDDHQRVWNGLLRKEVIQPHLPVRLPCYDFTPITDPTFDGSLPKGLGHRLRVLPTFVV
jgi:hypothetical protein